MQASVTMPPLAAAPFFCMMAHVTTYLKGLFSAVSRFMQFSKQLDVHWLTFASEYCVFCSTASIDSLMMLLTSSATNAASSAAAASAPSMLPAALPAATRERERGGAPTYATRGASTTRVSG